MMLSRKPLLIFITVIFASLLVFTGCEDDDNITKAEGSGTISMKMGDAPFPIDLVAKAEITFDKIDIRSVSGTGSEGDQRTYIVLDEPQTINLIDFRNGLTTDLPDIIVSAGNYDQVRLYIADAKIELTDGTTYDLKVPSGAESGLKVYINPFLQVNPDVTYEVLLDVDLTKSFVVQGNPNTPAGINGFIFKPVIRAVNLSEAGTIYGKVFDAEGNILANSHVWVEQDSVISSTYTEIDGSYRIIGLPSGTYSVYAEFVDFITGSVEGVVVSASSETEVNFELSL